MCHKGTIVNTDTKNNKLKSIFRFIIYYALACIFFLCITTAIFIFTAYYSSFFYETETQKSVKEISTEETNKIDNILKDIKKNGMYSSKSTDDSKRYENKIITKENEEKNNPYFFSIIFVLKLFFMLTVVVISVIAILFFVFIFLLYRNFCKQALLTYAYDEALKKIEDDRNKNMTDPPKEDIDSKTKKAKYQETNESTQGQTQHPKPAEETITMNRYYKKAITKIFETYCQNITSK